MTECKTCGNSESLQVKQNLFLCLHCIPENKQVYFGLYNKREKYGLTLPLLLEKWQRQRMKCAICFKHVPLFEICADHDHISNKVRGLLCRTCNVGLTQGVNISGLIKYIEDFKKGKRGKIRPHPERGIKYLSKKEKAKIKKYLPKYCEACLRTESDHFTKTFIIDHCHTTGVVRGHLCGTCNKTLGMFKDSLCRLRKAFMYLNGHLLRGSCIEAEISWPVTYVENAEELKIARSRKKAKLDIEKVKQIKIALREKIPKLHIARQLDVNIHSVAQIASGKTWKHVE